MKNVLFIVHEYYPYGSAITNCLSPIIKEMKKRNINIYILTRRTHFHIKKYENIDNIEVYRIDDWFNIYNNNTINAKNKLILFLNRCLLKIVWIYKTKVIKNHEGFLNQNQAIKKGKKIVKKYNIDTIISCSYPFSMHKIAKEIKNDNIKWVAYQFDPHTFNHTLNSNLKNKRLKEEIETFSYADKIFLPPENYEENMKTELKVLKDKYYPIDFALIKNNIANKPKKNNKIIFTFTGTFYENIRTPNDMLEFFKNIDVDYELHLYYIAEKTIDDVLLEYKKVFKDKLVLFNNKSKEECDEALKNSNIIINIGNRIANQTPSKVFEYISMGKPIINFYNIENDTSKKVLKNYPLVLNIKNDYTTEDIEKFNNFVLKNKDRVLTFEEIKEKYKTAEDIAKEFIREVNKCYGIK